MMSHDVSASIHNDLPSPRACRILSGRRLLILSVARVVRRNRGLAPTSPTKAVDACVSARSSLAYSLRSIWRASDDRLRPRHLAPNIAKPPLHIPASHHFRDFNS